VPRRVLLDTDIGSDVDDALALAVALASPELVLVAVTVVGSGADTRARVAARLLGLAGRLDVEVCPGEQAPLLRDPARFGRFGHEGAGLAAGPDAPISREPAPERIVRAAREEPGLELVAVGPLTNLARALALDPELPRRVAGLHVMGGHVREVRIGAHVCPPGIDYNLCSDPEAAVAVLGAGFRTTLVTADVTLRTWLRASELARLAAAGPLARALVPLVRLWEPVQRRIFTELGGDVASDNAAFLHDPLTVLALADPACLRFETLRIATCIESGVLRTHEVRDPAGPGAGMRVATDVDAGAAERAIVERLLRL
jgi:purine nucleosidase